MERGKNMIMKFHRLDTNNISCRHCGKVTAKWDVMVAGHCCLCDDCVKLLNTTTRAIIDKIKESER